jgi:hypothetical protein
MPMETIAELEHLKVEQWLTTGQLINCLPVGEVAVSRGVNPFYLTHKLGGFLLYHDMESLNSQSQSGQYLPLTHNLAFEQWRILPKFVTFAEATKAFNQGKTIWCEYKGKREWYSFVLCHEKKEASPSWGEIRFGKWSIDI